MMGFETARFTLTLRERLRAFLLGTYSTRMWKINMDEYEIKLKKCRKAEKTEEME